MSDVIPYRPSWPGFEWSVANKAKIPLNGEIRYFTASSIITGLLHDCSVLGDGVTAAGSLPFREILRISSSANVDLSGLRLDGNSVQVYNSGAGAINVNVGTSGSPVNFVLAAGERAGFTYVNSDWIGELYNSAEVDKETGLFTFNNAIILPTKSITADSDAEDVTGINIIRVDTTSGNVTLGGLANGTTNQPVLIWKAVQANTLTIEHNEAAGTQKFITEDTNDIILGNYGGALFVCYGSYFREVGH